jgi:hypothetical protein
LALAAAGCMEYRVECGGGCCCGRGNGMEYKLRAGRTDCESLAERWIGERAQNMTGVL